MDSNNLKEKAEQIKNENGFGKNTAARVGSLFLLLITWFKELLDSSVFELQSKINLKADKDSLKQEISETIKVETATIYKELKNKANQTDFDGERTQRYEDDQAMQLFIEQEIQRATNAETQLSSRVNSVESDILSHDKRLQAAALQISFEFDRAIEAEKKLAIEIGSKANQNDTYTKSDVDRIIEKTLSGGGGEASILINLKAPNEELWEKLSSNVGSCFSGYLTMGEEAFNLHVTWNPLGSKVEMACFEGMRTEIIILTKNPNGSISRNEEYIEYTY